MGDDQWLSGCGVTISKTAKRCLKRKYLMAWVIREVMFLLTWHGKGRRRGPRASVVTLYDPDAPTGSGWWHWVVINIPPSVTELAQGAGSGSGLPAGALQTRTDYGQPGYGGAAPPPGRTHRYIFTIHALKVERIDLDAQSSAAMVGFMTHMNSLGRRHSPSRTANS